MYYNNRLHSSFLLRIMNKIDACLSRFTWFRCESTGCTFTRERFNMLAKQLLLLRSTDAIFYIDRCTDEVQCT